MSVRGVFTIGDLKIASLSAAVLFACASTADAAGDARILYAEPLRAIAADRDALQRKTAPSQLRELRFDALGRRFELDLDRNQALQPALNKLGHSGALQLYRGELRNTPGSWVRLAVKGASVQGMIWDGANLYVVEPAEQVREALNPPLTVSDADTLIFKLQDVLIDAQTASCGVEDAAAAPQKASQVYGKLLGEIKGAPAMLEAAGASAALQISAVADRLFVERFSGADKAREAILIRLNNVDGIFSSQLGVAIQAQAVLAHDAASDPLSGTTSANTLLGELARLRKRTPELNAAGLTHLFTGRNLDGETVGIAYLDRLCHIEYGAGLTEVRTFNAWRDSLIAAHEIGHNFGASHDGSVDGACPTTPTDVYLMSPSVSGNDQFSQCSLASMHPRVAAASCIAALPEADITVPADLGVARQRPSQSFEWRLDVSNRGGLSARRTFAEIFVHPTVSVEDAYVVGGSCTSAAGVIFCQLGDVPGGAVRTVNLTLRSEVSGTSSIAARVASDNDADSANNSGDGQLSFEAETDVALSLAGPSIGRVGDSLGFTFTVRNLGASVARELDLNFEVGGGLTPLAAQLSGAACELQPLRVRCSLGQLDPGSSAAGSITLGAAASGALTFSARASGAFYDAQAENDRIEHTIGISDSASSTDAAESTDRRSGGGGSSFLFILVLSALQFLRGSRQRR